MLGHYDVLIVGAGCGGAQTAIALRQRSFTGTIGMLGEEPELPYERPPLSQEYLAAERKFERLHIRRAEFWVDQSIDILTGRKVVAVNPSGHFVTLADGDRVRYRKLIWATGGQARRLGCVGHDLEGVHTVRSRSDVDRLMSELPATQHVAVIGGGYIGLETAAVLCKLGKKVTVLEAMDRVLARVAGVPVSRFYEAEHRRHGVEVLLKAKVESIEEINGRAAGVRLVGGRVIPAQMVVVGIGILPSVEPLLAAGAKGGNGVRVDSYCRTSLKDIYAIGDCALHRNAFVGGALIRLESVQNATDMALVTAKSITGVREPYGAVPWFWSNQYNLRLQTVGLSMGHDGTVLRGDPGHRGFSVLYLKAGRVIALDCINASKDYARGRTLVLNGLKAYPEWPADVEIASRAAIFNTRATA